MQSRKAEDFLLTLNSCHPSINFTMELAFDNKLPFIGMEVLKKACKLETMRCVQLWMWSVWCRVCWLHQPAFTPTYWRTPLFSNRQALKERPRSENHRRPYQQLFRFKEVQRKTGMSDLWNAIHKEEKAMLEYTIRLHTCKTIYLNLSLVTCIFYVLSPCTAYIMLSILFSFTWKWWHGVIETLCKTSFAYF